LPWNLFIGYSRRLRIGDFSGILAQGVTHSEFLSLLMLLLFLLGLMSRIGWSQTPF
jgi:hypothetical protein